MNPTNPTNSITSQASIEGVVIKSMKKFRDPRGWLSECFRHDELEEEIYPVMAYISMTRPGIVRGPHEHVEQTDYFCFIGPSNFKVYLWDNRRDCPTYGKKETYEIGEENPAIVIIPPGVVHAYKNIGDKDGLVLNFANKLYAGRGKKETVDEVRHEDDPDSIFIID